MKTSISGNVDAALLHLQMVKMLQTPMINLNKPIIITNNQNQLLLNITTIKNLLYHLGYVQTVVV